MCLFKKNKTSEKTLNDRELIESNSKTIESLIVLASDNTLLIGEFAAIKEKIKYLIPSSNSKIIDKDKQIKNTIGDLRIALTKSNGQSDNKTNELITDLKLVIADRNALL